MLIRESLKYDRFPLVIYFSGAIFMFQSAMRWIAVWLDLLVVAVTCIVALLMVLLTGSISPADAGMAIAFAVQV